MNLDVQFKINNNSQLRNYLRENAHWYKTLNRNPERFNDFMTEMQEKYKLRPTDKVSSVIEKIELIQTVLNILK